MMEGNGNLCPMNERQVRHASCVTGFSKALSENNGSRNQDWLCEQANPGKHGL